jgi:hypothetical protein
MPLRWTIHHDLKLVHIVGEGVVTREDLEAHFDAIVVANAMPFGKLFDASKAVPKYDEHDMLMMGARLSAYVATLTAGPLAVVATSDDVRLAFRRFINMSSSPRPAAFFESEPKARAWLADQMRTPAIGPRRR